MIPTDCGSDGQALGYFFLVFCSFCRIEWYLGNRWYCRMLPARMREQVPALESAGEPRHLFALGKELHGCVDLPLSYGTHSNKDCVCPGLDPLPFSCQFYRAGNKTHGFGMLGSALPLSHGPSPHSLTPKARAALSVVEHGALWRGFQGGMLACAARVLAGALHSHTCHRVPFRAKG